MSASPHDPTSPRNEPDGASERFEDITAQILGEMLQGDIQLIRSHPNDKLVDAGPRRILLKHDPSSEYRIKISRKQPFEPTEKQLARDFWATLQPLQASATTLDVEDVLEILPRRVIGQHLKIEKVRLALERFERWSSQTYEAARISSSLGFAAPPPNPDESRRRSATTTLDDLLATPSAPVLTHGTETLMVFDPDGSYVDFTELSSSPMTYREMRFAPRSMHAIANWTTVDDRRVGIVLNERGKILVLRNGELVFGRRGGTWMHYIHLAAVKRMLPTPQSRALRESVYSSALDVSFEPGGGCVGVIPRNKAPRLISDDDRMDLCRSDRARLLAAMVGNCRFHELTRETRSKLMSLDGAVVIEPSGRFLAAGAILTVSGGSAGGGRRAAAQALGRLGLGIKISADGEIEIYKGGNKPEFTT